MTTPPSVGERRTIACWWALTCAVTFAGALAWILLPGSDPRALLVISGCVVTALGSCVAVVLPRRSLPAEAGLCVVPALLAGLLTAALVDLVGAPPDTLETLAGVTRAPPLLAAACTAMMATAIVLGLGRLWLAPAAAGRDPDEPRRT